MRVGRCCLWLAALLFVHLIPAAVVLNAEVLEVIRLVVVSVRVLVLIVVVRISLLVAAILILVLVFAFVVVHKRSDKWELLLLLILLLTHLLIQMLGQLLVMVVVAMISRLSRVLFMPLRRIFLTKNLINWRVRRVGSHLIRRIRFPVAGEFVVLRCRFVEIFQLVVDLSLCNSAQHVSEK